MSLKETIDACSKDPVIPIYWGVDQKGMSAGEALDNAQELSARASWTNAHKWAVRYARLLQVANLHKQWTNRIIAPFMWVNEVVTSTDWDNFFALRVDSAPQPEVQRIALMMYQASEKSKPKQLRNGEWHIPYVMDDELTLAMWDKLRISAARCARQSYAVATIKTWQAEYDLYHRLMGGALKHVSPTEHQLRAEPVRYQWEWTPSGPPSDTQQTGKMQQMEMRYGGFRGFLPFRMLHEGHTITDVKKFWRTTNKFHIDVAEAQWVEYFYRSTGHK